MADVANTSEIFDNNNYIYYNICVCAFSMYTCMIVNVVYGYTTMVRLTIEVYEYDACDKYGRFMGTSHLLWGN